MNINDLSITFHTDKVEACRDFYVQYFNAKVTFDCGWYVTVQLQSAVNPYIFLSFMEPQAQPFTLCNGGTSVNLAVDDVDAVYKTLKSMGAKITSDIADFDWGGRSFDVADPLGNTLCIFSPREIVGEYKDAVK